MASGLNIVKTTIFFFKRIGFFLVIAGFLFNVKLAKAENINSAISAALVYNTSVKIAKAQNEQAKASLEATKAQRGANVSILGNLSYYQNRASTLNQIVKDKSESFGFRATIVQPLDILSGSKIAKNIQANEARFLSSHHALANSRATLILDTISIYSDLDYATKVVTLRKNSFATFAERLRITKAQLKNGEASAVDLAQTQMSYHKAIIALENAKNQYLATENLFKNITGRKPVGKLNKLKKANLKFKNLAEAQQKMLENSNNIKRLLQIQKASQFDIETAEAQFLPSTNLAANYEYNKSPSSSSTKSVSNTSIALQIQMQLYDSGLRSAKIDNAKNIFLQNNAVLEEAKRDLINQLNTIWNNYNNSLKLIKSHKRNIKSTIKVRDAISAKQRLSEVTRLQLLDADLDVVNAQLDLAQEQKILIISSYQIKYLLGKLDKHNVDG